MGKSSLKLWIAASLLFAMAATMAVYKVWPLLHPEVVDLAPLDPNCDLRAGPCTGVLPGGGRITFGIKPDTIPLIETLELDVRVDGVKASSAEIDFVGVDMNMGFNRPKLSAAGEGRFSGQGVLPVCVRKAMEWEARVLVKTNEGLVAAPFRFITVNPDATFPGK